MLVPCVLLSELPDTDSATKLRIRCRLVHIYIWFINRLKLLLWVVLWLPVTAVMAMYHPAVSPKLFEPVRVIHSRKLLLSSRTYPYEYMLLMILPLEAACFLWVMPVSQLTNASVFRNNFLVVGRRLELLEVLFDVGASNSLVLWQRESVYGFPVVVCSELCVVCCCRVVLAGILIPKFDFPWRQESQTETSIDRVNKGADCC
jgi:hypothetical protein